MIPIGLQDYKLEATLVKDENGFYHYDHFNKDLETGKWQASPKIKAHNLPEKISMNFDDLRKSRGYQYTENGIRKSFPISMQSDNKSNLVFADKDAADGIGDFKDAHLKNVELKNATVALTKDAAILDTKIHDSLVAINANSVINNTNIKNHSTVNLSSDDFVSNTSLNKTGIYNSKVMDVDANNSTINKSELDNCKIKSKTLEFKQLHDYDFNQTAKDNSLKEAKREKTIRDAKIDFDF